MPKIPVSRYWKSFDDDAARNFEQVNGSNVRQAPSARVMTNLAHGVNHLAARTPRPMFGKSQSMATVDQGAHDPKYEWRYNDSVDNGEFYVFTMVRVPRTSGTTNTYGGQWTGANHYDGNAIGAWTNATASSVNRYYDATYETVRAYRPATVPLDAEISDGFSTTHGYTALHVGVQEEPLYWLDTSKHIYCDPTLAKKGGKVLADAAADVRDTFHTLRTTNLPIVMSWSEQGQETNDRAHTNSSYANLFDTSIGARNSDTPGATYDAQYCSIGNLDQRAQANVKVMCRLMANVTSSTENITNVMFWGPLGNVVIPISANGPLTWHGNTDHYLYLDANVAGTDTTVSANKIDCLAAVHDSAADYLNWKALRCWVAPE